MRKWVHFVFHGPQDVYDMLWKYQSKNLEWHCIDLEPDYEKLEVVSCEEQAMVHSNIRQNARCVEARFINNSRLIRWFLGHLLQSWICVLKLLRKDRLFDWEYLCDSFKWGIAHILFAQLATSDAADFVSGPGTAFVSLSIQDLLLLESSLFGPAPLQNSSKRCHCGWYIPNVHPPRISSTRNALHNALTFAENVAICSHQAVQAPLRFFRG